MSNNILVLGAHGAKSKEGGSSSFLLNNTNVIDAGNLLLPLEEKSADIAVVWVTHSHLDHIADLAYILDNYFETRTKTLRIMALEETIDTLKAHFFNDKIWPDFSKITLNNSTQPVMCYESIELEKCYKLEDTKTIQAFLGDHSVASVGYIVRTKMSSLLLSADTYSLAHIVELVKNDITIKALVVECSFPIRMGELAKMSKHLTAQYLFEGLEPLKDLGLKLYINHIKPVYKDEIISEITQLQDTWNVILLEDGDTITF